MNSGGERGKKGDVAAAILYILYRYVKKGED